ncbi:protein NDUFAF4 homolog [Amyelois transitella]|uniref:protein NDUFAF4 homolog n=1 Tax=Amyelois transitella TaxID=680683 RepID=UPI00298F5E08|nr:protein NDUFAF4 homolog [Amyelois transitella]
MGALVSKALRPIKSFNIENRAHRVISKEKPVPAPLYPDSLEDLKRAIESDPDLDTKLDKKDPDLDIRLRDVYVTSHGQPEDDITREKQTQNPDRPLPQDRRMPQVYEYGFKEPERVKYGHVTLKDTLNFISAHQSNPEEVTVAKISLEYKLKEEDVESILKYFKSYEVYIPQTKKTPAVFAGPSTTHRQLQESNKLNAIESKESSANELDKEKAAKSAT